MLCRWVNWCERSVRTACLRLQVMIYWYGVDIWWVRYNLRFAIKKIPFRTKISFTVFLPISILFFFFSTTYSFLSRTWKGEFHRNLVFCLPNYTPYYKRRQYMFAILRCQRHPFLQSEFPISHHPKRVAYHISLIVHLFILHFKKLLIKFSPFPSKPTLERLPLSSSTPCPERFQNEGQNLTPITAGKITVPWYW